MRRTKSFAISIKLTGVILVLGGLAIVLVRRGPYMAKPSHVAVFLQLIGTRRGLQHGIVAVALHHQQSRRPDVAIVHHDYHPKHAQVEREFASFVCNIAGQTSRSRKRKTMVAVTILVAIAFLVAVIVWAFRRRK